MKSVPRSQPGDRHRRSARARRRMPAVVGPAPQPGAVRRGHRAERRALSLTPAHCRCGGPRWRRAPFHRAARRPRRRTRRPGRRRSRGARPASSAAVIVGGDAGVGKTRLLGELLGLGRGRRRPVPHRPLRRPRRHAAALPAVHRGVHPADRRAARARRRLLARFPALARLLPGRSGRAAGTPVERGELFDSVLAGARRPGRERAGRADRRGRPLGRPGHARSAGLPVHPHARRAGGRDRHATAATTCTAATRCAARSPSGRGCRRSPGCSSTRSAADDVRASCARCTATGIDEHRRRRHRAPRRRQRLLRRGTGRRHRAVRRRRPAAVAARRPAARAARPALRRRPPGRPGRRRRRPAGHARHARGRGRVCPSARLDEALREAIDAHVLQLTSSGRGYVFRHALLAEAVYDDLLPGERVRLHAAYAAVLAGRTDRRAAELARHARASHDLPTAYSASVAAGRRGDVARRPAGGAAALRDRARTALRRCPTPRTTGPISSSPRSRPPTRAGHTQRGLKLARRALAELPDDAAPVRRATLLLRRRSRPRWATRSATRSLALTSEALHLVPERAADARSGPGCSRCTPGSR